MSRFTSILMSMMLLVCLSIGFGGGATEVAPNSQRLKTDLEYVGIEKSSFERYHRSQKQTMWCWASCAEMVLAHQGVDLPQEAIVNVVKGAGFNAPGNPLEMVRATNHFIQTRDNRTAVVSGQFIVGPPLPNVLYNHLKRGKPVILSYQSGPWIGHAVVVYGMDVRIQPNNPGREIMPVAMHVADPFAYRQVVDHFGNVHFREDTSLRFRKYAWTPMPDAEPFPGQITGAILVEATLR